ncbi:hypothetical protein WR25_22745 [Diploscapter pachys]|uniref:Uncharacterized protein n=1 Tax=Diploscapter pachys TaxID=2018661 RepID=A0A2A2KVG1_9BILA|nr:hypothetical protein WR25_22745 [Diploscapter pachys]
MPVRADRQFRKLPIGTDRSPMNDDDVIVLSDDESETQRDENKQKENETSACRMSRIGQNSFFNIRQEDNRQLKQQLEFNDVKDIEEIYSNKFSFDPRASASDAKVPRKYIRQRIHAMGRKLINAKLQAPDLTQSYLDRIAELEGKNQILENQLKEQKTQLDELRGYAKEVERQRSFFEHPNSKFRDPEIQNYIREQVDIGMKKELKKTREMQMNVLNGSNSSGLIRERQLRYANMLNQQLQVNISQLLEYSSGASRSVPCVTIEVDDNEVQPYQTINFVDDGSEMSFAANGFAPPSLNPYASSGFPPFNQPSTFRPPHIIAHNSTSPPLADSDQPSYSYLKRPRQHNL